MLFFPLVCWAVLGSACVREEAEVEVSGQVFVTGPQGESVPLSLVAVRGYERDSVAGFLERREEEIEVRKAEMRRREDELREAVDAAKEAREEAEAHYGQRHAAIERERAEFHEETSRRIESYEERIRNNETFIIDLDGTPQAPEGIPTREEYEAFRERRDRWFSMTRDEREAWREVLGQQIEDLAAAIEEVREERRKRVESWDDELAALSAEVEEREAAIAEAERALTRAVEARSGFPTVAEFFEGLPPAPAEVRTDANGEFALFLPESRRVALVALVDREIRGNRERHGWLLWVDPARQSRQRILLSNHNSILLDGSPEEVAPDRDSGS